MSEVTMRTTGVIRRIDDLGRIVVTKEIRRKLAIREGDPLELYVGDDFVAFKKYNPAKSVKTSLAALKDAVVDEPALECKTDLLRKLAEISTLLEAEESSGGVV